MQSRNSSVWGRPPTVPAWYPPNEMGPRCVGLGSYSARATRSGTGWLVLSAPPAWINPPNRLPPGRQLTRSAIRPILGVQTARHLRSLIGALLFPVALLAPSSALRAQEIATLADLQEHGAVVIRYESLKALMTGARVVTYLRRDRNIDRAWTNHPDGKFIAFWRRTGVASTGGQGEWRVDDRGPGLYCVAIIWQTGVDSHEERWCAAVYRLGDRYYAVRRRGTIPEPSAIADLIEIRPPIATAPMQP
jgi:hypothetical protein